MASPSTEYAVSEALVKAMLDNVVGEFEPLVAELEPELEPAPAPEPEPEPVPAASVEAHKAAAAAKADPGPSAGKEEENAGDPAEKVAAALVAPPVAALAAPPVVVVRPPHVPSVAEATLYRPFYPRENRMVLDSSSALSLGASTLGSATPRVVGSERSTLLKPRPPSASKSEEAVTRPPWGFKSGDLASSRPNDRPFARYGDADLGDKRIGFTFEPSKVETPVATPEEGKKSARRPPTHHPAAAVRPQIAHRLPPAQARVRR